MGWRSQTRGSVAKAVENAAGCGIAVGHGFLGTRQRPCVVASSTISQGQVKLDHTNQS